MNEALGATDYVIGYWIGLVIGSIGVGVVCGLVPLAAGAFTKQKRVGTMGFVASIAGGFIAGAILAVPIALGFCIFIVIKWNKTPSEGGIPPSSNT